MSDERVFTDCGNPYTIDCKDRIEVIIDKGLVSHRRITLDVSSGAANELYRVLGLMWGHGNHGVRNMLKAQREGLDVDNLVFCVAKALVVKARQQGKSVEDVYREHHDIERQEMAKRGELGSMISASENAARRNFEALVDAQRSASAFMWGFNYKAASAAFKSSAEFAQAASVHAATAHGLRLQRGDIEEDEL